jgi:hypothetical protein
VETVGGLEEVPYHRLSDQTRTRLGTIALAIHPERWKHAETENFIYHYINSFIATPASQEAEYYYRVISKDLGQEGHRWNKKSHIYIFEEPEAWQQFVQHASLDPWTGGVNAGNELFIQRNPEHRWKGKTLGHEVSHLLLNRYYGPNVPLWLNEGYAEYISEISHATFHRIRGYLAKPRSEAMAPHELLPITQVVSALGYPKNTAMVRSFYLQSEKLVRFLHLEDENQFPQFLQLSARGTPFSQALNRAYGRHFRSAEAFESAFREYATRHYEPSPDAGSTEEQESSLLNRPSKLSR